LARQRAADPGAATAARRAALQAYDQARERRLIAGLSVVLAVTVGAALAYFVSTIDAQPAPRLPSAAASPQPAPPVETTAAVPTAPPDSPLASSPAPAANIAYTQAVEPAAAEAALATDSQQAPVEPPPNQTPLGRDEAREVQTRLRSFGFNPGPVDGVPRAMTEGAIMRYQQNRGQPQTGKVDRELLEQLRQDPAPKIVQRAAGPYARPTPSPGPRRSDPFEPVRAAGDRLGQWLDSRLR
jgi:hypothetical protein